MTRKQFLAFSAFAVASVFGFVGLLKMFASHAATPTADFEAEDGTVSGPAASVVTDTAASGGAAIAFGTVTNTFVLGTTKPVASNTASFADGQLPIQNGDLTITTSGTATNPYIVEGKEIRGFVKVQASYVILRNCRIVGRNYRYYSSSMVDMSGAGTGCRIENCEITAYANGQDNTRYWLNGIGGGSGWTAYRCNIHDVIDGISASGNDVRVQGTYIHDLTLRTDDNDHKTDTWAGKNYWTHNDGIQFSRGDNWIVEGNNFQMTFSQVSGMIGDPNAPSIASDGTVTAGNNGSIAKGTNYWPNCHGILLQAKAGNFNNIQINNNWFSGATYLIQANASGTTYTTGNTATFSGNRIYVGQTIYGASSGNDGTQIATQMTIDGNVGTYAGLLGTVYASDDTGVTAIWRGHVVQPPSSGGPAGNYKYNPTLSP